ncbi:hypothetical protein PpBr36_08287 [Pyricularia pennisetigena]|uniref:hypothetical protein n=1 Tax=Pyricularia pennisetigena TaxID=1578925 RepID=UPI001151BB7C|nr:hypothetical protein PpBr36_08287 [Pyricularia pennisetigena]TLS24016.1 hypothetical protein PpBr36_08287 [Pyricularia pennisetigena]
MTLLLGKRSPQASLPRTATATTVTTGTIALAPDSARGLRYPKGAPPSCDKEQASACMVGSGQVRRYLASKYLSGAGPVPPVRQSATAESLAETIRPFAAHSHKICIAWTDRQATRLPVLAACIFPDRRIYDKAAFKCDKEISMTM